ncbi:MAG: hypothetical protein K8U57_35395 [Planctomycetes bacterium]|nr:hypothetical protein [Planctomycetota bacterium]
MIVLNTQVPDDQHLRIITTPSVWVAWPFLPLVRRVPNGMELGVLFDAKGAIGRTGFSATVFDTNLFTMPSTLDQFLALHREVYDSAEELIAAGWRTD